MSPAATSSDLPYALLRQSAQWRLAGLLFEPPDDPWRRELMDLVAEAEDAQLAAAVRAAMDEAQPGLYHSTLGPGGPGLPREVSHQATLVPGGLLAELEGQYAAFGYRPSCEESPDHVAVEAGFVAYLRLKQAYAAACGRPEHANLAAETAQRFLEEHLARIAAPLAAALANSQIGYLAAAAEWLRERSGVPAYSNLPVLQPGDVSDDPIECVE